MGSQARPNNHARATEVQASGPTESPALSFQGCRGTFESPYPEPGCTSHQRSPQRSPGYAPPRSSIKSTSSASASMATASAGVHRPPPAPARRLVNSVRRRATLWPPAVRLRPIRCPCEASEQTPTSRTQSDDRGTSGGEGSFPFTSGAEPFESLYDRRSGLISCWTSSVDLLVQADGRRQGACHDRAHRAREHLGRRRALRPHDARPGPFAD